MALSFIGKRFLLNRTGISLVSQKRTGYIVLVPEIGEEPTGKNPLFGNDGLPEFNNFTIENCIAGIGHQALNLEKEIRRVEEGLKENKVKDIFAEVIEPIEEAQCALEATWGVAKTIYLGNSSLMPTKSYLSIHERARKANGIKYNNLEIYKAIQGIETNDPEKKRILKKYALEGKLNGVGLGQKERALLFEVLSKLGDKRSKFQGHVSKAIDVFQYNVHNPNIMIEFPPHLLQAMAADPKNPTNSPWKVKLQPHIVKGFLEYCPNHDLRWNIWQADTRKASGQSDKALANSSLLEEIRGLRQDQAKILGYKTYADMSMETKMIGSVENLEKLFKNLLDVARPVQDKEISDLIDFAEKRGHNQQFEIHDVPYWRRKQLMERFGHDEEALRDYFPSNQVVSGMFKVAEEMFGIKIVERKASVWDEDVKFYDVFDANTGTEPIGGFYMDLFSRDEEKSIVQENLSGWMVALRNRSQITDTKPLSALIFSFPPPIYGKPSLLSLREIQSLFFKFGQALQHVLTKAAYSDVAGLSSMQWDVVEVAGNLLTHLLYDANTLKLISSHYKTQDPLPDSRIAGVQASRSHLSAFSLCQELYLSNLDLQLHKSKEFWLEIARALYADHFVFKMDKRDAHVCSFTQIFSGEWGAAYFSHLHAKMIAADVFSAFEEARKLGGDEVLQTGKRFKDTFLSHGGSEEAFRQFRGRDPSPKALLKTIDSKIKQ